MDIDPIVESNVLIDEGITIGLDGKLPLENESVDLIVSWAVFEHVTNPKSVAAELYRVLKPGGFLCAWTPNNWSYFAIAARLIPNALHHRVVAKVQPGGRTEKDVFPTAYRINTKTDIRRWFPPAQFEHFDYVFDGPPAYHGENSFMAAIWTLWGWLLPNHLGQTFHIFLRKRAGSPHSI